MSARCVMVLGTHSGAGKSWLATALARCYRRRGLRVAPFKAQNMSNNARVVATPDGAVGEIGSAQYFQALAAGCEPDTRMNPVLLKPVADTASQVVVDGLVRADLSRLGWRERSPLLWPHARAALRSLAATHDVLVIEGAGSPAEINLAADDFVNTRTALAAQAACLLVGDIDRGGVFAHLFGTHAMMDPRVSALLRGFVLNRFRGDPALLAPAPELLRQRTGVATLAVVPMQYDHGLPDEDAPPDWRPVAGPTPASPGTRWRIAIVAAPHLSNLDEFRPLARVRGVTVDWVRDAGGVAAADWLILPGSKNTRADLRWLRGRPGLADAIAAHVAAGRPTLAICGGLQLVGRTLADPGGHDGEAPGSDPGLGLAPWHTTFAPRKTMRTARATFAQLDGPWRPLSGAEVAGYEIHAGHTGLATDRTGQGAPGQPPPAPRPAFATPQAGWQHGGLLAIYLHGLLENREVLQRLFGDAPPPLDDTFDRLADAVEAAFEPGSLDALLR